MKWRLLRTFLGAFVSLVVINLMVGLISFSPVGQVAIGLGALGMMLLIRQPVAKENRARQYFYPY